MLRIGRVIHNFKTVLDKSEEYFKTNKNLTFERFDFNEGNKFQM